MNFFLNRYLATGESLRSLAFAFRISHNYLSTIIKSTLAELKIKLVPIFLPDPKNIDFKQKSAEFSYKWNFPNCILAIDGKHVRIRSPSNSGTLFYNHKDFYSIVLLAMVDVNYKFIVVDIGFFGKEGDSGIFLKSDMGQKILNGTFGFPEQCKLPGSDKVAPHVIVGDEAFRLHTHILKPYTRKSARENPSEAVFNYRLSRARRVTENAFGLLRQIFRIFYQPINLETTTIDDLIWVTCCLHNMLREGYLEKNKRPLFDYDTEQPPPTDNLMPLSRCGGFSNIEGFEVRNFFKEFFNNEGSIPWQTNSLF